MTITLRPYQTQLIDDIRAKWDSGAQNVLAVMPTGAGDAVSGCAGAGAAVSGCAVVPSKRAIVAHSWALWGSKVICMVILRFWGLPGEAYNAVRLGVVSVHRLSRKARSRGLAKLVLNQNPLASRVKLSG